MFRHTRNRQQGITLIELMVSVAVGLVLLAGIISIFVSNKQAYRLQESTSVLNENARYALGQIAYHLRMGEHWGGVQPADITVDAALQTAMPTTCTESPELSGVGFVGFDGAATTPLACIPDADYENNTDILIIRYGEPARIDTNTVGALSDVFICVACGRRGIIYQGSGVAGLPGDMCDDDTAPDPAQLTNYQYNTVIYFIRECASQDLGTAGVCDGSDDSTPTLSRVVLNGTTLVQEDVIAGVEQMQITYGVLDNSVDPPTITYQNAATTTTNNEWGQVTNIQVSLIVRGEQRDTTFNDTTTYTMYGGFPYTPAAADRPFRRKLFNFAVQIRNLTRA